MTIVDLNIILAIWIIAGSIFLAPIYFLIYKHESRVKKEEMEAKKWRVESQW